MFNQPFGRQDSTNFWKKSMFLSKVRFIPLEIRLKRTGFFYGAIALMEVRR
jgi:hypothetical protein